jgi:hypothetical protein
MIQNNNDDDNPSPPTTTKTMTTSEDGNAINDVNLLFQQSQLPQLPKLVCSKIARVYNYEGRLKQGITSFFTLKRFGDEIQ